MTDDALYTGDVQFVINSMGEDTFDISVPDTDVGHQVVAQFVNIARVIPTPSGSPVARELDLSGDLIEDLEKEMSNDHVQQSAELHHDLQDMRANQILETLVTGQVVENVSSDDMFELSMWFNRRRHALKATATNEHFEFAALLCAVWSEQCMEASL